MNTQQLPIIVLTRPHAQSLGVASCVSALGFDVVISPVGEVFVENDALSCESRFADASVIVVSSQHALAFLRDHVPFSAWQEKIIYTPSEVTATIAREMGAKLVRYGVGDAQSMLHVLCNEIDASNCKVIYLRGDEVRVDAQDFLVSRGYDVESLVCYRMRPLSPSSDFLALCKCGASAVVLLYSRRAAAAFEAWLRQQEQPHGAFEALCFSTAIAHSLKYDGWAAVHVAVSPTTDAMMSLLKSLYVPTYSFNEKVN